ncbi:MAG: NAD(+) diphosphatase [Coriobacteriales bacterium]|jgi:NAD+ diphosphatase|nr:NAD(+) diphosphatase [Coriobacteriales bacterium]
MLHEIDPRTLDITFLQKPPGANSVVFAFQGDKVLVNTSLEACFPLASMLDLANQETIYLFRIDETEFFLARSEKVKAPAGYSYETVFRHTLRNPGHLTFALTTAQHLHDWYSSNRFCGACGNPLEPGSKERMLRCAQCGTTIYPRISPVVIVGVYRNDELLLTRYAGRAYKNYALVAGYIEIGEDAEDAIRREVAEEVGLQVGTPWYYRSQPWGLSGSLIMGFFAELDGSRDIVLDSFELSEAAWVHRDDIQAELDGVSITWEMIHYFKYHPESFTKEQSKRL